MKKTVLIALVSFFLGIFVAAMILVYSPEKNTQKSFLNEPSSPSFSSPLYASYSSQAKPDLDFVKIADKVGPSVVRIASIKVEKRKSLGFGDGWPFDDWWDRFFDVPRGREQEFRQEVRGTGFFISSDGYVVTNNHLVQNAEKVTVSSLQNKEYTAKIIGTDPGTDLALLKIDDKNLPFAELGDSARLNVGEWVLAIGNPLGFEHTVSAGIVSAKGRQLLGGYNVPDYQDFIQTDAAINRGNSGGPLVNMKGEVIGINAMIVSSTGGNIGIGFAIPSSLAKKIVKQIKEEGRVVRGWLGVLLSSVTEDTQKLLNLNSDKGALVVSVDDGSPADKAGLKQYDVITAIDGEPVEDSNTLKFKIAEIRPETKIKIKVTRDGKENILTAKLVEKESEEEQETSSSSGKDLGLSVRELSPRLAARIGYRTQEGLLITEVRHLSAAHKAGLKVGDIILEINRKNVEKMSDLRRILNKLKSGDPLMLMILREKTNEKFIVTLRIPE